MPETRPPLDIAGRSLAEIASALEGQGRPPVERWNPPHCGHSGIRIDGEGRWWHDGDLVTREALVRLFASVLRREPDGSHVLVTPIEKLDIDVEFAALRVLAIVREGDGRDQRIAAQINDGSVVMLDAEHPLSLRRGRPVVAVHGGLEASLARPVWQELAELALDHDPPGIWSHGTFFDLSGE